MTTAVGATATTRAPMTSVRKTALAAGILYLLVIGVRTVKTVQPVKPDEPIPATA